MRANDKDNDRYLSRSACVYKGSRFTAKSIKKAIETATGTYSAPIPPQPSLTARDVLNPSVVSSPLDSVNYKNSVHVTLIDQVYCLSAAILKPDISQECIEEILKAPDWLLISIIQEVARCREPSLAKTGLDRLVSKIMELSFDNKKLVFMLDSISGTDKQSDFDAYPVMPLHDRSYGYEYEDPLKSLDASYRYDNMMKNKGNFGVARLLFLLEIKTHHLPYSSNKATSAKKLHEGLSESFNEFLNKKIDYREFKEKWDLTLNTYKPELEKHRGWKNLLANLVLFVATLGVAHTGAFIAKQMTGKPYTNNLGLFSLTKTDSMKHVDNLEQSVKELKPLSPSSGHS